jgi:hypothetical protein
MKKITNTLKIKKFVKAIVAKPESEQDTQGASLFSVCGFQEHIV